MDGRYNCNGYSPPMKNNEGANFQPQFTNVHYPQGVHPPVGQFPVKENSTAYGAMNSTGAPIYSPSMIHPNPVMRLQGVPNPVQMGLISPHEIPNQFPSSGLSMNPSGFSPMMMQGANRMQETPVPRIAATTRRFVFAQTAPGVRVNKLTLRRNSDAVILDKRRVGLISFGPSKAQTDAVPSWTAFYGTQGVIVSVGDNFEDLDHSIARLRKRLKIGGDAADAEVLFCYTVLFSVVPPTYELYVAALYHFILAHFPYWNVHYEPHTSPYLTFSRSLLINTRNLNNGVNRLGPNELSTLSAAERAVHDLQCREAAEDMSLFHIFKRVGRPLTLPITAVPEAEAATEGMGRTAVYIVSPTSAIVHDAHEDGEIYCAYATMMPLISSFMGAAGDMAAISALLKIPLS